MCYNPHNESEVIANSFLSRKWKNKTFVAQIYRFSFRVPFEIIKKMFVKCDKASASQIYVEEKMTAQTVCSKNNTVTTGKPGWGLKSTTQEAERLVQKKSQPCFQ